MSPLILEPSPETVRPIALCHSRCGVAVCIFDPDHCIRLVAADLPLELFGLRRISDELMPATVAVLRFPNHYQHPAAPLITKSIEYLAVRRLGARLDDAA